MTGQAPAKDPSAEVPTTTAGLSVVWIGDATLAERYVSRRASHVRLSACGGPDMAGLLLQAASNQPPPDVLVIDSTMPGIDPLQVLDLVKSQGLDLPVVLITPPSGKDELILQVSRLAICDCVVKTEDFVYQMLPAFAQVRARHDLHGVFRVSRESEEHLRHILETQPAVVFVLDPETRVTAMNRAGLAMLSAGGDKVVGQNFTAFLPEEEQSALIHLIARACAGEAGELEHSITVTDGDTRRVRTHVVPLPRSTGPVALATLSLVAPAGQSEDSSNEIERLTVALAEGRAEADALRVDGEALRADREALRVESEAFRADGEALRAESEVLRVESQALRAEGEALRAEREAFQTESEALRTEREAAESRWAASRHAADEAHRSALAERDAERAQQVSTLETRVRELEEELSRAADRQQRAESDRDAVAERERTLQDEAAQRERALQEERADRERVLEDELADRERSLLDELATRERTLTEHFAAREQALNEDFAARERSLDDELATRERTLTEHFAAKEQALDEDVAATARSLKEELATRERTLTEQFAAREQALNEDFVARDRSLNDDLGTHERTLTEKFAAKEQTLNEDFAARERSLNDQLAARERLLNEDVAAKEQVLNDALDESEARHAQAVATLHDIENVRDRLSTERSEARTQLSAVNAECGRLANELEAARRHAETIISRGESDRQALGERERVLREELAERERVLGEALAERERALIDDLAARERTLSDQLTATEQALSEARAQCEASIADRVRLTGELDAARSRADALANRADSPADEERRDLFELRELLLEVLIEADQRYRTPRGQRPPAANETDDTRRQSFLSFPQKGRPRPSSASRDR